MANMNENDPPDTVKSLADRLKWARDRKGWTQPHLALVAEVSTSTVGMIESDKRMNKGSLPQLASALGVRHRWLLHGEMPVREPLPQGYIPFLDGDLSKVTAVPAGTARIQKANIGLSAEVEQRLTRFLRALHQVPEDRRASALLIATEVLLDHLPPPPTA